MSRSNRAEVDKFLSDDSKWQESLEMSKQATNAGRALDGEMKLAYSHEEYIKMEKVLYSSWIDYYKQHQWNTLADNFENILTRCEIATDTQWLNYLRNRNVPDGVKESVAATFFNCIQSGIDEERKLPETEEEIEFYLVKKQAQSGDPNAMVTLSKMYLQGYGCYKDEYDAIIWLKKAARAGHSQAQEILLNSSRAEKREIVKNKPNPQEIQKWVDMADKAALSCDWETAFTYRLKAAEAGHAPSMCSVGYMYFGGNGTSRSKTKAKFWFEKAFPLLKESATNGDSSAMYYIGKMYIDGRGVSRDYSEGIEWLHKAVGEGNTDAVVKLSDLLREGKIYQKNLERALQGYSIAAEQGNTYAMIAIGSMLEEGEVTDSFHLPTSLDLVEKGEVIDSLYLHLPTNLDLEIEENRVELALKYYDAAAQAGNAQGKKLAELLRNPRPRRDCFITTAVCESFGKQDDCYELTTFRFFRDNWLVNQLDGASLIAEYYSIAPKIVDKINRLKNSGEIYQSIWDEWLSSCLKLIEQGRNEDCKIRYINMVNYLKKTFLAN